MSGGIGTAGWIDTTVEGADGLRDCYASVTGLVFEAVSRGEYDDYNMTDPDSGAQVAGISHARGGNAEMPPGWLVDFTVAGLIASLANVRSGGGSVRVGARGLSGGRIAVIEDPASGVATICKS